MSAPLEQHINLCISYIQRSFEKAELKTEEDFEQLRLAWLAVLSGDEEGIALYHLRKSIKQMRTMYQDAPVLFGVKDPKEAEKMTEMLKDAIWQKAEQLGKMISGKLRKKYLENWEKVRQLENESKELKDKSREIKGKIDKLRESL